MEDTLKLAKKIKKEKEIPKWAKTIVEKTVEKEEDNDIISIDEILDLLKQEIEREGGQKDFFGSARKEANSRA